MRAFERYAAFSSYRAFRLSCQGNGVPVSLLIVECCRRRGLDPFAYLRDTLTRLPSATNWQVPDLTHEAWAKRSLQQAA
jgi:transposase